MTLQYLGQCLQLTETVMTHFSAFRFHRMNYFPESASDRSLVAPFQADVTCIICCSIVHYVLLVQSINSVHFTVRVLHPLSRHYTQTTRPLVCGSASVYLNLKSSTCSLPRPYNKVTQILLKKKYTCFSTEKNFRYSLLFSAQVTQKCILYRLLLSTVHKNVLNNKYIL